jgi:dihydrofolate reductase
LPDDFAWFKKITMGKPIVMGRRTWESIGRPLPGRRNVVISRKPGYEARGADVVGSPDAALELLANDEEVMVIGGGEIYRLFLERATNVYLTRVDVEVDGDTVLPELPAGEWTLEYSEARAADERHAYDFEFRRYARRASI